MKLLNQLKWKQILAVVAGVTVAGSVMALSADMSREAIAERIKPAAQVRLAGTETQQAGAVQQAAGERSGEEVYNASCAACHTAGVLGAPKPNVADEWEERVAQGMDIMLQKSIDGFNAMPPRGTCMNCSDDEILAAIEFMIEEL